MDEGRHTSVYTAWQYFTVISAIRFDLYRNTVSINQEMQLLIEDKHEKHFNLIINYLL